jgi:hypothetical protein
MQTNVNDKEYWEAKETRTTRTSASMNANNNAVTIAEVCTNLGIYKYVNETLKVDEKAKKKLMDEIRMDQQILKDWATEDFHPIVETKKPEIKTEHIVDEDDEEHCMECGNAFTDGEIRWQLTHTDEPKLCYKCKKQKGLVK